MNEEDIIKKCGKGRPFTVPEGYFEHIDRQLMEQLPRKTVPEVEQVDLKITPWQRIKPLLYMAAMFVGIIIAARYFVGGTVVGDTSDQKNMVVAETATDSDALTDDIDVLVEYAMLDDYTVYRYLTDAE